MRKKRKKKKKKTNRAYKKKHINESPTPHYFKIIFNRTYNQKSGMI